MASTTSQPSPPRAATKVTESLEDILYGSLAGVLGKYIEYPFDTVKVRLQSQPHHTDALHLAATAKSTSSTSTSFFTTPAPRYTGPLDCFRQAIRADGFAGLYRGISAPLVGAALETSSLFFFERLGRETLVRTGWLPSAANAARDEYGAAKRPPLAALWFTGAFSGFFTSFVLTPVELVKCRVQVSAPSNSSSNGQDVRRTPTPMSVMRSVYRNEGIRGFWHGQMGTLIRESGGSAAWFGSKETTTNLFRDLNISNATSRADAVRIAAAPVPLWQQAVAGATAGVLYNLLFFPADTIKSRMQTAPAQTAGRGKRTTFAGEAGAIWRQTGLKGFYRGCGITCLRAGPSSAVIFIIFDGMKKWFPIS